MITKIHILMAVLSLAVCAATAPADLLDDGSFELASDGTTISNSAWSLTANSPDGVDLAGQFSTTVWAASDGATGVWFRPFEGNQDPGDPTANATLTQTVSGVAAGDYTLTFQSARETNVTAGSIAASLSSSGTGGSDMIDLLTATYNDDGNMGSDPTTFTLSLAGVSAGDDFTVTVDMVDGVDSLMNPQSILFDNFNLVPEPGSLALIGLGLLGALAWRCRR